MHRGDMMIDAPLTWLYASTTTITIGDSGTTTKIFGLRGQFGALRLDRDHRAFEMTIFEQACLGVRSLTAQQRIDRVGDIRMYEDTRSLLLLDDHIEGGGSLALEHRLLRATSLGLLIAQRHRGDAANQIGERGVEQQIIE